MNPILSLLLGGLGGWFNNMQNQDNIDMQRETNSMNERINWQQMEHADQAATTAYNRQQEMYNNYFAPSAMRQQYENAGLSVGMMYGMGGGGGNSSSVAQANTPAQIPMQAPFINQKILDASLLEAATKLAKSQAEIDNIKADTAKKESEIPVNEQTALLIKKQQDEIDQKIEESNQRIDNMVAEKVLTTEKTGDTKAAAKLKEAQTEYIQTQTEIQKIIKEYTADNQKETINKLKKECTYLDKLASKLGVETQILNETKQYIVQKAMNDALLTAKNITLTEAQATYYNAMAAKATSGTIDEQQWRNTLNEMGLSKGAIETLINLIKILGSIFGDD